MSGFTYDLIIVGGGIPGLTLACGLRGSGLRVAVIETQSEQAVGERPRAYALSPLSARIFRTIGIWEQISPAISHFPQVILSDADYPHRVVFTPADLGEPAVYYCAEHRVLQTALRRQASTDPHITCYYETRVQTVTYGAHLAEVIVETKQGQQHLSASLVVAADGAKSLVRQQAGIKTDGWNYWQSCITAFVSPAQPHRNIAHERFWSGGPFAILPLPDNCCQIVWVVPHREAAAISALPPDQFIAALQHRYGDHSGSLTLLNKPLVFPARLMHSRRYCQPRLALLGDAAHHCHPVGGQGLNLGIRDAAMLAQVLATAKQQQQDLGDVRVLQRYGRRRRLENWVMLLFTDILNRTFSNRWLLIMVLRRWVLRLMIRWSPLRRLMLHLMTGFWGTQLDQLARAPMMGFAMPQHTYPETGTLVGSPKSRGRTR
ncbi:MAG: FAD-dependent hydroxylase [Leptolyngbya sp. SIO1E4]|nr:FAD-dependent hydroxylase [Leptolyngbya sp. SIO1E4]